MRSGSRPFLIAALLVLFSGTAGAANYPLQLMHPRAAGTSSDEGGPVISANHRIFWAYPGLEYNIRAAVIGGAYPYSFALTGAPPGMTVHPMTGVISWPNPPAGATVTPTLSVTDSEGTVVSAPWTIQVDASRFIFIDAQNGQEFDAADPGTGTITDPFRRIRDLYSGNTAAAQSIDTFRDRIAYFRQGTYYIDGYLENVGDMGGFSLGRLAVSSVAKPIAWLAYPGEVPTIDGQCIPAPPELGVFLRPCNVGAHIAFFGANNVYWDGLRIINMAVHGVRTEGYAHYQVFRRNTWMTQGPTVRSANAGMLTFSTHMFSECEPGPTSPCMGSYTAIQDNTFSEIDGGMCVEMYSVARIVVEDNVCHTVYSTNGFADDGGIFVKGGQMNRVTVRANTFCNMARRAIAGNMFTLLSAEILFNRVYDLHNIGNYTLPENYDPVALDVNQNGVAGVLHIHRNTFVGRVIVNPTDEADGPFHFTRNVIVNSSPDPHIVFEGVNETRVHLSENLAGSPAANIVDAVGDLTGSYTSFLGLRGYQRVIAVPNAPTNLRLTPGSPEDQ